MYSTCTSCVLDTTVPSITFDQDGVCQYCDEYHHRIATELPSDSHRDLAELADRIRSTGARPYDCVIGLSGGVDSTYVAHIATHEMGLRPLAVHLDNGWNTELAVANIERTVRRLDIDLYTNVLDWEEFRSLQVAFLRASIANAEIPTDHAIMATLFKVAHRHGIQYILTGNNLTSEAVLPRTWMYDNKDSRLIRGVARRFGAQRLRSYPVMSPLHFAYFIIGKGIRYLPILNYVDYSKAHAKSLLSRELGWRDYGGKHHESIFTRFFQGYVLPNKFGIDKRKAHLSNLILSGQLSREVALAELREPPYSPHLIEEDLRYVAKKLQLSLEDFEQIMSLPTRSHADYPNNSWIQERLGPLVEFTRRRALLVDRHSA